MKLVFCVNQIKNHGGIERVLSQRVNYLMKNFNYDITIITTDNNSKNFKGKDYYFPLNFNIKIIDLNINYDDLLQKDCNYLVKKIKYMKLKKIHLKKLKEIIKEINPDVLISLGDISKYFCFQTKSPCKKIIEHHFNKEFYMPKLKNKKTIEKIKYFYRNYQEKKLIDKYDEFLVLTNEDRLAWNNDKIKVINNPLAFISEKTSNCSNKKVISVGRLEKQKGFDMLIDIWEKVNKLYPDWILEIYGEGSLRKELQNKIDSLGLTNSLFLKGNEKNIQEKYLNSSIYVMSSRFEGFGMVLIEAMNCGLPIISFGCPCGPKDLIEDGENGYLCKCFDIDEMAERIIYLIKNEEKRIEMGKKSRELSFNYSEDKIMSQWKELFENLIKK